MSSFKNYTDIGVNRHNSGIDTASDLRLGRSCISRGSSNIYRSSYSSSGLNYGTGARNNGNIYCTTKNGHYPKGKIIDTHWERNRGIIKNQTVISTRNATRTSKYSDTLFSGVPYPKSQQYRYKSSSRAIDNSCTTSSIPIKTHSSLSATKYPALSCTPSSVSSTGGENSNFSSHTSLENTEIIDTHDDFSRSQDCYSDAVVSSIDVIKKSTECEDFVISSISRDSSPMSQFTSHSGNSHAKSRSVESLPELFCNQITGSDFVAMTSCDQKQNECTIDKHSEFSVSSENKVAISASYSSPNAELHCNCIHASCNSNKSSTSNAASDSSKSRQSFSQEILEHVDREYATSSNSNYSRSQSEPSKGQAKEQQNAQNSDAQSDKSFCSLSLSQQSFGSSLNDCICKKTNDSSTHKSDAAVSSSCNNSARSSRKLVASSSSVAATELTALKIKSAATTTIAAASSNSGGSDGGSTSKSSSSIRSSCSNSSSSNISSDSNNSIRSQSASDASKSSNGKREFVPAASPVSCSQSVSSDVHNRKPPIPKPEMITKKMSGPNNKYVNKDFRKSALNMENGDASRSQITKKKYRQKASKSPSLASQESQGNVSSSKQQLITDPSSQSFSSDGSNSNSSNENEEQNQPTYACKTNISQNTNELSEMNSGAKQLVSSPDERSINVNSSLRTRSGSSSKSGSFNNFDAKEMDSPLATTSHRNKKSWCTASLVEENSRVSDAQSFTNGSQCANLNGNLSTNQKLNQTQHQYSDEVPWWLDPNSDNVPEGVERHLSAASDDISQDTTISTVLPDDGKFKFKIWRQGSEERCWWLDDNDNDCTFSSNHFSSKNEVTSPMREPSPKSMDVQSKNSSLSKPSSPEVYWCRKNALKHEQSGERAWWLSDDPNNVPEGVDVIAVSSNISQNSQSMEINSNEKDIQQPHNRFSRLRHIDSGERPWWLDSSSNVPEGVEKISLSDSQSDDSSDSSSKHDCSDIQQSQPYEGMDTVDRGIRRLASFPLSDELLGDRTSPEGLENPPNVFIEGRCSPYDNIESSGTSNSHSDGLFQRKKSAKASLYIGNQTNIDDLLEDLIEFDNTCQEMENQNENYIQSPLNRNEKVYGTGLCNESTDTCNNIRRHKKISNLRYRTRKSIPRKSHSVYKRIEASIRVADIFSQDSKVS